MNSSRPYRGTPSQRKRGCSLWSWHLGALIVLGPYASVRPGRHCDSTCLGSRVAGCRRAGLQPGGAAPRHPCSGGIERSVDVSRARRRRRADRCHFARAAATGHERTPSGGPADCAGSHGRATSRALRRRRISPLHFACSRVYSSSRSSCGMTRNTSSLGFFHGPSLRARTSSAWRASTFLESARRAASLAILHCEALRTR